MKLTSYLKNVSRLKIASCLISLCFLSTTHFAYGLTKETKPTTQEQKKSAPEKTFTTRHIFDAKVEIGEATELGATKYGTRRMIPITGGTFSGAQINGIVLSGGADFQVTRADGDTEFTARYMLKTSDGIAIQVINRALFHQPITDGVKGLAYMRSVLELEAPTNSAYDYLNHAIFLGTLEVPQWNPGEKPYVIIGVYQLL